MNKLIKWNKLRYTATVTSFLAPDVLGLLFVFVIPIVYVIYVSFNSWNGIGPMNFVGLSNYIILFKDPIWLKSVGVTVVYVLIYVSIVSLGSLGLALLINTKIKGVKIFRVIYFLPIVMPLVVAAIVWNFIYEPSYGFLNYLFKSIGLAPHAFLGSQREALFAVVIVSTWKQLGYYMIIYLAGLNDIPKEYYEASMIDGASSLKIFRYVTIPLLKPIITFVVIINLIFALQDFDPIFVLTIGVLNYATYVQTFYIYEKAFKFMKMGVASAASVVLFIMILIWSLTQLKFMKGGTY